MLARLLCGCGSASASAECARVRDRSAPLDDGFGVGPLDGGGVAGSIVVGASPGAGVTKGGGVGVRPPRRGAGVLVPWAGVSAASCAAVAAALPITVASWGA